MPHDDSWEAHTAGREQRAGRAGSGVLTPLHAARANLHGTVETKNHKPGLIYDPHPDPVARAAPAGEAARLGRST